MVVRLSYLMYSLSLGTVDRSVRLMECIMTVVYDATVYVMLNALLDVFFLQTHGDPFHLSDLEIEVLELTF